MTGSFAEAVDLADEVLRVHGRVMPITLDNVTLCAKIGREIIEGEFNLAHKKYDKARPNFFLTKRGQRGKSRINPDAEQAILRADLVVVAPGNLYGSLAPALLPEGVGAALRKTTARKVYITNLVTKPGQTDGFKVHDFAAEIERLAGGEFLDYVVYNVHQPSKKLLERYAADGELPVEIDAASLKNAHYKAKGAELLAGEIWQNPNKKDPIASSRTLIRHDPDAVARAIMKIYFS
jgi:uncharacterized cofD-like protein